MYCNLKTVLIFAISRYICIKYFTNSNLYLYYIYKSTKLKINSIHAKSLIDVFKATKFINNTYLLNEEFEEKF